MLSSRGYCEEPTPQPGVSYRVCVCVCVYVCFTECDQVLQQPSAPTVSRYNLSDKEIKKEERTKERIYTVLLCLPFPL